MTKFKLSILTITFILIISITFLLLFNTAIRDRIAGRVEIRESLLINGRECLNKYGISYTVFKERSDFLIVDITDVDKLRENGCYQ